MSTDFQTAREALGARLRELRTEAGLEGRHLAAKLGCQPSKVSRLQNGKQTPAAADLTAWASACGRPDVEAELQGLLAGLEMKRHRSWRRQLASGHRGRQEIAVRQTETTQPGAVTTTNRTTTLVTKTDLNGNTGVQSVEEGAEIIVRMAQVGPDGPTGGYFDAAGTLPW